MIQNAPDQKKITKNAKEEFPVGLASSYEQHSKVAQQAKAEYLDLYRQMVATLSTDHLDPFAKIIFERDNSDLKLEPLVASLRQHLLHALDQKLDSFWTDFDVANSITSLEMLKENFRKFEGTDWNLLSKTPEQRTLPMRMHFKQMQLRHLQKQLQSQNAELEEIMKINAVHRATIQQIEQQRICMKETMERLAVHFKEAKPELLRMMNEADGLDDVP